MKRFRKVYVEISNLCNLRCHFCPGTRRTPRRMSPEEFAALLPKLQPYTIFCIFMSWASHFAIHSLRNFFVLPVHPASG